jgi:uncharacterized protein (UPF0218 family)
MAKFVELHGANNQPLLINFDLVQRIEPAVPPGGSVLVFVSGEEKVRLNVSESFESLAQRLSALRA